VSVELLVPLAVLALVDSTSFGTLLIPLWLMLAPGRVQPGRVVLFLATVAGLYLLLGITLAAGALAVFDRLGAALDSTPARIVQLVVGIVLLVLGLTIEPWTRAGKQRRAAARAAREAERGGGRLTRWRARAMGEDASSGAVVSLALTAAGIEAVSMVPYLAAIGLLTAASPSLPEVALVLTGYCALMVLPALLLLVARVALHERVTTPLQRIEGWMTRNAHEALAWVLALLGFYLASTAATGLFSPGGSP
jgi:cytochrome c biogenesis protein CcdA